MDDSDGGSTVCGSMHGGGSIHNAICPRNNPSLSRTATLVTTHIKILVS